MNPIIKYHVGILRGPSNLIIKKYSIKTNLIKTRLFRRGLGQSEYANRRLLHLTIRLEILGGVSSAIAFISAVIGIFEYFGSPLPDDPVGVKDKVDVKIKNDEVKQNLISTTRGIRLLSNILLYN